MAVVTEVMDPRQVGLVAEYAGMLQVGSRNMQNYPLLRALAALAAGADGLLIEVHLDPKNARSDGQQTQTTGDFYLLMDEIRRWILPSGRYLPTLHKTAAS